MRVEVVRTPGELRDLIGHKIMVHKGWQGQIIRQLSIDEIAAAGFHPGMYDKVYLVKFDDWEQEVPVPSINLVLVHTPAEQSG